MALATSGGVSCAIRVVRGAVVVRVPEPEPCTAEEDGDAWVDALWVGRSALAAEVVESPSPHGDAYTFLAGPLPRGPLREAGGWSWNDSDVPTASGCAVGVAAGGGVIASAPMPNRLSVDRGLESDPACPARQTTRVTLRGAAPAQLTVDGSWRPLATDGKQLVLARLDDEGLPTGELAVVGLDGATVAAPSVAAATVKAATRGWLTPDGLVLETASAVSGPGWSVRASSATVANGRVVYVVGRSLRVRRIRGGPDRLLATLPVRNALVAVGSLGVALATGTDTTTTLYRIPWRTVDAALPAR